MDLMTVLHKGSTILSVGWCQFRAAEGQDCHEIEPIDIPDDVRLGWEYDEAKKAIVRRETPLTQVEYEEMVFGPSESEPPKGPTPEERIAQLEQQIAELTVKVEGLEGGVTEVRSKLLGGASLT